MLNSGQSVYTAATFASCFVPQTQFISNF